MKHLALLRAVNVSGHNMIKMDALKKALESIGFKNVETYIQSGNVFVETEEENPGKVSFLIKQEIYKTFGHDVAVIMVEKDELQACVENNPFLKDENVDVKKLYFSFITSELPDNMITQLKLNYIKPDQIQLDKKRVYIKYDSSPGKTKLDNKWIEKNMNVVSTIRNWNTVNKLLELYGD
jgi:uncharacterized protein (DUF1697 family)